MSGNSLFGGGSLGQRKFQADDELDITPMIDCVFLLLIFFMVTSTMNPGSALRVPAAKHGEGVHTETATFITIAIQNDEPLIYLGDGVTDVAAQLSAIPNYVQEGLNDASSPKTTVIIKADREVPSGFIEEVARTANQVQGIEKFYVGVQDKR